MTGAKPIVLTHGGAGSRTEFCDGTDRAARSALEAVQGGASALEAACRAVAAMEDDGRFNAGRGSKTRADGSRQMDAACMDGSGRFGAVALLEGFRNPVRVAQAVCGEPQRLLAGRGAGDFARARGFEPLLQTSPGADGASAHDTVGCVVYDGRQFAAALSTGGTGGAPPGRVGDVPLVGCGLYAGPAGALCATGLGEAIAMNLTAYRAYRLLEQGASPEDVLRTVLEWFKPEEDFGLLVIGGRGHAGGSNRAMAWSVCGRL